MSYINLKNIFKQYSNNNFVSVNDFNLKINKGEFIVFVGPSGCGKSTTLRMIAGLETISDGSIEIDNTIVNNMEPKDRDIAMVFQNYALYPHLSVADNITLSLKVNKFTKVEIEEKLKWSTELLGLDVLLNKKPRELSGGQRQRVALGRAIVRNPKVFLMDEPLSNLDAKLRVSMRNEILAIHKKVSATTIYVTHDQVEAMTMADRIVVMNKGEIQQIGTPLEIYNNPNNIFVAGFIGSPNMNFIEATIRENQLYFMDGVTIAYESNLSGDFIIGIRPDSFIVGDKRISLKINSIEKMGNINNIYAELDGKTIIIATKELFNVGDNIDVDINLTKLHIFDKETGVRILC